AARHSRPWPRAGVLSAWSSLAEPGPSSVGIVPCGTCTTRYRSARERGQGELAMSKRREIDVRATSTASVDAVYRLLADGTTWPAWSPIQSYELEAGSGPPPDGIGEIRIYRRGRTTGRDQIV